MMEQRNGELSRWVGGARQADERGVVKDQEWPGTVMAIGVFVFVVMFWVGSSMVYIGYLDLFRWLAVFAFAGNLLPYVKSGLTLGMERLEWFLFNLLAVGPVLWGLALLVNIAVHGEERVYALPVKGLDPVRYWREHDALPPLQEVSMERVRAGEFGVTGWENERLTGMATGCLGWEVRTWPGIR